MEDLLNDLENMINYEILMLKAEIVKDVAREEPADTVRKPFGTKTRPSTVVRPQHSGLETE